MRGKAGAIAILVVVATTLPSRAVWAGPVIIEEEARLQSPDAQTPLNSRVALHGNRLVAASETMVEGSWRCAAYLFERPSAAGAWTFTRELLDLIEPDDRGSCHLGVDITSDAIVVGTVAGVRVHERLGGSWIESQLVRAAGSSDFGSDVAASNDMIVVGGTHNGTATAYVYRRTAPGQWAFEARLAAGTQSVSDNDFLGEQVAADGEYAAIGNPSELFNFSPGRLFVFRHEGDGLWIPNNVRDFLTPALDGAGREAAVLQLAPGFGVGAYTDGRYDGFGSGASIFVEDNPDSWTPVDNVRPLDAAMNRETFSGSRFNSGIVSVELGTATAPFGLATGVPDDEDRGMDSGSVTLYAPQIGYEVFTPVAKFLASDSRDDLRLGQFIALHGETLAAVGGDRVYIFRIPTAPERLQLLQDDFADGDAAGWNAFSANWTVTDSQGSRVYRQGSSSGEHWSMRMLDWTNVAIEADVRPLVFNGPDRWASLMTRYQDTQNYYYVALRNTNVLRLARRVGNSFTTLASTSMPVTAGRSYRIRLEAVGTWLRVYVDGVLRLQARDVTHRRGGVGFKTAFTRAEFDNVIVSPNPSLTLLADDFVNPPSGPPALHWTSESGSWTIRAAGGSSVLRQSSVSGRARAITGVPFNARPPEMADQIVHVRARGVAWGTGSNPWFGLIARYRDAANYTFVTVNRAGRIMLRKLVNNTSLIIDQAPLTVAAGTWYTLRLEAVDDLLRVYVNGRLILEGRDPDIDELNTRGRYGLVTFDAAAEYDDFKASQP